MADGDPLGVDLASGTTDGDTLSDGSTGDLREITFSSPVSLLSGKKYAVVVKALSGGAQSAMEWYGQTGNPYANGASLTTSNAGSSWGQTDASDLYFITKASGVNKDSQTDFSVVLGVAATEGPNIWFGQSFTTTSAYLISSVELALTRFLLPGILTVSIQQVEGENYFAPPVITGTVRRLCAAANNKFWFENI